MQKKRKTTKLKVEKKMAKRTLIVVSDKEIKKTLKKMKKTRKPKKISKAVAIIKKEIAVPAKRKLSMTDTFITENQLAFLIGKTPAQHIYSRPGKGGGKWDYVTGVYVTKVLNYVFGWNWDFEIKDKGREGDSVWVQGRLTIRDEKGNIRAIKEQFGGADVKFKKNTKEVLDYRNDLKSAATDALKKCASELGIAGDVYGKNEFKDIGVKEDKMPMQDFSRQESNNNGYSEQAPADYAKPFVERVVMPEREAEPEKEVESQMVTNVKNILRKRGATTTAEALELLTKLTGLKWKNFEVTDKAAELALKSLINK